MLVTVLGIIPLCYAEASSEKTPIEDIKNETQDLLTALKSYTSDQRDEAIQKTKSALEKIDKRIDTLETRIDNNWDNMNAAARKKARDSLKTLRKQRIKVAEWYGSLKRSSIDAWEHMKKGFSDAYEAFSDAWEKAEKEFGSSK
jgi:septal ring factor EnvC (AmiA/AmiB activator)